MSHFCRAFPTFFSVFVTVPHSFVGSMSSPSSRRGDSSSFFGNGFVGLLFFPIFLFFIFADPTWFHVPCSNFRDMPAAFSPISLRQLCFRNSIQIIYLYTLFRKGFLLFSLYRCIYFHLTDRERDRMPLMDRSVITVIVLLKSTNDHNNSYYNI